MLIRNQDKTDSQRKFPKVHGVRLLNCVVIFHMHKRVPGGARFIQLEPSRDNAPDNALSHSYSSSSLAAQTSSVSTALCHRSPSFCPRARYKVQQLEL